MIPWQVYVFLGIALLCAVAASFLPPRKPRKQRIVLPPQDEFD